MEHTIEFLKRAREAGATHCYMGNLYKRNNGVFFVLSGYDWGVSVMEPNDIIKCAIDFTPLDNYYADKDLDIRATGVGE